MAAAVHYCKTESYLRKLQISTASLSFVFTLGRFVSIKIDSGAIALLETFIWTSVNAVIRTLVRTKQADRGTAWKVGLCYGGPEMQNTPPNMNASPK